MARIAAGERSKSPNFSIKTIWGLAKSPELNLNEEELYTIVCRETGKDSLRALSQDEINQVCRALTQLKDGVKKDNGRIRAGMATEKWTDWVTASIGIQATADGGDSLLYPFRQIA